MKAKVMPDGRMSLPADLRRRHGLGDGGEVMVEDVGHAIVLRTLDQVVARAQAISRRLVGDKLGASVATSSPTGPLRPRPNDQLRTRRLGSPRAPARRARWPTG